MGTVQRMLLLFTILVSAPAFAGVDEWAVAPASVSQEIRVESTRVDGVDVEVVHLPNQESFSFPAGAEAAVSDEAREVAREALELTLRGALSEDFNGAIVVSENGEAASLAPVNKPYARTKSVFKRVFAFNADLYLPAPAGLSKVAKLKRFAQSIWQFVIVETLHAGHDYVKEFKAAPKFQEYGFAIDFKIEPQVFLAKFNPTARYPVLSHNYALFFEISYSRLLHRVVLNTRFRRETGSGGLGLPAVKAELKFFQSDGFNQSYSGKAWYPISPPVASFVFDSSEHYFAQGFTIGLNSGDLVPFSTLTNTFTSFEQSQRSYRIREIPRAASAAFIKAARTVLPRARAGSCSALFGR